MAHRVAPPDALLQEVQLFDMSIHDNICIGRPEATYEEVVDAAQKAGALEFISALPGGFQARPPLST